MAEEVEPKTGPWTFRKRMLSEPKPPAFLNGAPATLTFRFVDPYGQVTSYVPRRDADLVPDADDPYVIGYLVVRESMRASDVTQPQIGWTVDGVFLPLAI